MGMLNRGPILTNFEKQRIDEVKELIDRGVDPLTVSIASMGGEYRLTFEDVANYRQHYNIPFNLTVSCFRVTGVGKDVKRKLIQ